MNTDRSDNPGTPDRDDEDAATGTAEEAVRATEAAETAEVMEAAEGKRASAGKAAGKAARRAARKRTAWAAGGGRRSSAVVVSALVGVLLAGGGGAYLAATADDGTGPSAADGEGTPPLLALDGYTPPSTAPADGAKGIAPGEPGPYGVAYEASGDLPAGPGTAPVYRPSDQVTADEMTRLAAALGVSGTPVAKETGWWVGPGGDGFGPSLQAAGKAPGNWTFQRYAPGTDTCKGATDCPQSPTSESAGPVSVQAAEKAAAPVLKALGQDDSKIDTSQVIGAQRVVNADPAVGGLPTYGWQTALTVDGQGEVVSGSGLLKAPRKGDTYPVLSARRTLDLLNATSGTQHRMGIGGCASPVPLKDRLERPCAAGASPAAPSGSATVRNAVFGLASHSVEGRPTLVPSWLFEVHGPGTQETRTVTYPAVDPRYLRTSTPAAPSAAPPAEPSSAPRTRDVAVDGYSAGDSELTVSFTGGVCADYTASADEGTGQVKVTVTERPWPDKVCILIAKEYRRTVPLHGPLGDRKVVGTHGEPIPEARPGTSLPEASAQAR